MSFQVSAIHAQWRDSVIFETANNTFRRNVNPKRTNEGVYFYYGHKLVLKWNNWGEVTMIKSADGVFRYDNFSMKFGDNERKLVQVYVPVKEPVAEPIKEPIDEPVAEPIKEPIDEPVDEPIKEPVAEPVDEPIKEPVAEPVDEPVAEPVDDPVAEPVAEPVKEPVAVPVKEPVQVLMPAFEPMPMESFNSVFQSLDTHDEPLIMPDTTKFSRRKPKPNVMNN